MPSTITALPLPHPTEHPPTAILIGVDTHKAAHVAVAVTALGARVAACRAPADREGYAALLGWAEGLGRVEAFGVEGTGSYGVGVMPRPFRVWVLAHRARVQALAASPYAAGQLSPRELARTLETADVPTPTGRYKWHPITGVHTLIRLRSLAVTPHHGKGSPGWLG